MAFSIRGKKILVYDYGLFLEQALQLARDGAEVKYFTPWAAIGKAYSSLEKDAEPLLKTPLADYGKLINQTEGVAKLGQRASQWIPRLGLGYLVYRALPGLIKQIQQNQ